MMNADQHALALIDFGILTSTDFCSPLQTSPKIALEVPANGLIFHIQKMTKPLDSRELTHAGPKYTEAHAVALLAEANGVPAHRARPSQLFIGPALSRASE